MAEKPRLKDSDEILNSLGKKRAAKKQPAVVQSDVLPPPIEQVSPPADDAPPRRGRPRKEKQQESAAAEPEPSAEPAPEPAQQPQAELQDRNPLDFGKYELPKPQKRRGRPRKGQQDPVLPPAAPDPAPAEAQPVIQPAAEEIRDRSPIPGPEAPDTAPVPEAVKPTILRAEDTEVQEFSFTDLDLQRKREARQRTAEQAEEIRREAERARQEAEQARLEAERVAERAQREAKQAADRAQREILEAEERARKTSEEAAQRARREEAAALELAHRQAALEAEILRQQEEEALAKQHLEAESRRRLAEDDEYRENVMGKLSDEFEQQFSQVFDGDPSAESEDTPWWLIERRQGVGKPVRPEAPEAEPPQPEPVPQEYTPYTAAPHPTEDEFPRFEEPPVFDREMPKDDSPRRTAREEPAADAPPVFPPFEEESPFFDRSEPFAQPESTGAPDSADDFLNAFEQQVRAEEQQKEESFQETLAQKFMRERERYLRDLGIDIPDGTAEEGPAAHAADPDEPPVFGGPTPGAPVFDQEHPVHPPRKMDFQIRPEMHRPPGKKPIERTDRLDRTAARIDPPVIYTRGAEAHIQEPPPDSTQIADEIPFDPPKYGADGKKTPEQLLLELGAQTKKREEQKKTSHLPASFHFRFPTEDEDAELDPTEEKPRRRLMPRIVAISACVCLAVLLFVGLRLSRALSPDRLSPLGDASSPADVQPLHVAYENYNPDTVKTFTDVVVKRSGISMSNIVVQSKLVVDEEAAAEGALSLNNVMVDDYIYINSSGVNEVNLRDVQTPRLVIKNDLKNVTIRTSGSTSIDTIELHTAAAIEQDEMLENLPGVRAVTTHNSSDSATALVVSVKDIPLQSFTSTGEAVVTFSGASAETMTANGSLNLSGTGRVTTLSAGTAIGAGAGDTMQAYPVSVFVKGVEIGHIFVKSPANLNLSSTVESVAVEDPVNLGGNGTIGTLIFNENAKGGRLAADIAGLRVQHLITNAETTIYSSGSSVINTLTANQSTYALGNKVNLLVVNAEGVIFENEPDGKRIADGVSPPQSKAENPNLDYSRDAAVGSPDTDTTDSEVATTCNHTREAGGFLLGDGSADAPFVVETPAQLAHISQHLSSHFTQSEDIDIATDSSYAGGFAMIGAQGTPFSGSYDGAGFAVRNLRISSSGESVGLFAENTGTIKNLHIASGEVATSGRSFVGGLVGMNYQGGLVSGCSNGALISAGGSAYAGGIVGYNYGGKVRDCYNTAKVVGGDAAGGLVGMNRQSASLTGCYNVGVVESDDSEGAVAGINEAVVTNCYYLRNDDLSGIGEGEGVVVERSAAQFAAAQMAADLAAGADDSPWEAGDPYPRLVAR